ncbi:MAG TPA: site-2 protease family protein [Candidatus Acidoferrales bacterium]|nr:site-2 protease family protein [Candidatus Acidoferrales bacterium]
MSLHTNGNNGHGRTPADVLDVNFRPLGEMPPTRRPDRRPLWPALVLFLLTLLSTLAVGSEFASSYAQNREPFSGSGDPFVTMLMPFEHPQLLLLGIPFSLTLLGILLAHELGHYFACKIYGIDVSYPYFIPAPTLFGTFGAFIRIRSPITTRRALFDVGLAGPVVGFLIAVPAMALAIAQSKIVPGVQSTAAIIFGTPPLMHFFITLFHPHVDPRWLLISPAGRAAWVGFFATALNLLPLWQLDGGHIVYSLTSRQHQRISIAVALGLLVLGWYSWSGWYMWGGILLILTLRFGHPPVLDRWEPLDVRRRIWAVVALAIFLLCFTPWPAMTP